MNTITLDFIEKLKEVHFFCDRNENSLHPESFSRLTSKDLALKHAVSNDWFNLRLMVFNRMNRLCFQRAPDLRKKWNSLVDEITFVVNPIIDKGFLKLESTVGNHKNLRESLSVDILDMCLESERSKFVPPMLALPRLFPCYQAGFFPCGWTGANVDEYWAGVSDDPLPKGKILYY